MRILLVNDDGIEAEGIRTLEKRLEGEHEVWVCAPDGDRSGMSHGLTLRSHMRMVKRGERRWACSGLPVDCVILALCEFMPERPDAVLSGINHGSNLGTDVIYSGTAAAARQAAMMGIPGIALSSCARPDDFRFGPIAEHAATHLETLMSRWKPGYFMNVNYPDRMGEGRAMSSGSLAVRSYEDKVMRFSIPRGGEYCFLLEGALSSGPKAGTDWQHVNEGRISVSRVAIMPEVSEE